MKRSALAAAALLLAGGAARAQSKFEEAASKAVPVDPQSLGALFWAASVDCSKNDDDMLRRQCEGVREARADAEAGQVYVVTVDPSAFTIGDWDEGKKGVPLLLRGCLACNSSLDVAGTGEKRYITTKGAIDIKGGAVVGPELHKAIRSFKDKVAAERWKNIVGARLKTQLVFKVPSKPDAWSQEGAKGYSVELVAFRVYDPCDGGMVCSNPPSANEVADKAQCKGGMPSNTDIEGEGDKPKPPVDDKPKEPELPDMLSNYQIKQAMQGTAVPGVNACFATYGVPGKADLRIEIQGADGTVKDVELKGDFVDTPTGDCIVKAVKKTAFPKFKRATMTFPWPFILR